jgi:hypothetical protein
VIAVIIIVIVTFIILSASYSLSPPLLSSRKAVGVLNIALFLSLPGVLGQRRLPELPACLGPSFQAQGVPSPGLKHVLDVEGDQLCLSPPVLPSVSVDPVGVVLLDAQDDARISFFWELCSFLVFFLSLWDIARIPVKDELMTWLLI